MSGILGAALNKLTIQRMLNTLHDFDRNGFVTLVTHNDTLQNTTGHLKPISFLFVLETLEREQFRAERYEYGQRFQAVRLLSGKQS
jgi:hypothetical protein